MTDLKERQRLEALGAYVDPSRTLDGKFAPAQRVISGGYSPSRPVWEDMKGERFKKSPPLGWRTDDQMTPEQLAERRRLQMTEGCQWFDWDGTPGR